MSDRVPTWQAVLLGLITGALSGLALSYTGALYCFVGVTLMGLVALVHWFGRGMDKEELGRSDGLLLFLLALTANGLILYVPLMVFLWIDYQFLHTERFGFDSRPILLEWIVPASLALGVVLGLYFTSPARKSGRTTSSGPRVATCWNCQGNGRSWVMLANRSGLVFLACQQCGGYGKR